MASRAAFRIGYREPVQMFVNESLADQIEKVIRDLAGVVGDRLEQTVKEITENAEQQWPRGPDKGGKNAPNKGQPYHSQDTFVYGLRIRGNYLEGYVDNYATNVRGQRYWFFIKTLQGGLRLSSTVKRSKIQQPAPNEAGSPINAYVKRPMKEASARIAVELAEEIRMMVREGGG